MVSVTMFVLGGMGRNVVAEGTRADAPPSALMVPDGRGSKTQNGSLRGTVKFGRTLDEFSLSLRSAPDLRSGAPAPKTAVLRQEPLTILHKSRRRWGVRSLFFAGAAFPFQRSASKSRDKSPFGILPVKMEMKFFSNIQRAKCSVTGGGGTHHERDLRRRVSLS